MEKIFSVIGCSQENFYVVATNGFSSCLNQIVAFAAYKASYTSAYVQQQLDAVYEAQNMKTFDELNLDVKKARQELEQSVAVSRQNWIMLKGYVNAFSTGNTRAFNLAEAGSNYYGRSFRTWPAMNSLLVKSNEYIDNNEAALVANNNMPATFAATYRSDTENCNNKYKQLYELQNIKGVSRAERIIANNAIYKKLMDMFADGQCIFAQNEQLKKEFIFSQVLRSVKGSGIAGMKGIIKAENGMPLAGVIIASTDGKYSAVTNDKGYYHIAQILAGTYRFSIEKPGYQRFEQLINIEPGTTRRGNFTIVLPENLLQVA